jgi:SAM-dependent methyltransferase
MFDIPVLPPGTQLQLMYLRERLQRIQPGRFIEIGPGGGEVTALLLGLGWTGFAYDIESITVSSLRVRFANQIIGKRLVLFNGDFLSSEVSEKVDLVISCMVMEHLDDEKQTAFMIKAADCLKPEGVMFALVPASPLHWGIEDDIAGHRRRYTKAGIEQLIAENGWKLEHIAGLNFPLSNVLLPISNLLVDRRERNKLLLSFQERTKKSGMREVKYKTHFPPLARLFLNKYTLFPFYILQKIFSGSERALVLAFEAKPCAGGSKK